jgi:DNA-binding CsgD family transcriptional regulator
MTEVVGRDAALASIQDFVAHIARAAAGLVLEGEAGMGKTTLWRAAIEHADQRGVLVLEAQPVESETTLSFAGLGDLFDPVLDRVLGTLRPVQERALTRALALGDDDQPDLDPRTLRVAVMNAIRALADDRPVLLAIDDSQWLDYATSAALAYGVRRFRTERVGLLLSRRSGLESVVLSELLRSPARERFTSVHVGPLEKGELGRVVQEHLGKTLPRPLLAEVYEASGGNPFYALEIVRMLERTGVSIEAGRPLPVPDSLHDLVHGRLLALPPESRHFLIAAAAHARPTISITAEASGVAREVGLVPAREARIVETDRERILFTHPLLAAGALETADPRRRAEVHARLAELLEDPEARAWQLAASVDEPDAEVAAVIEDAADHARKRGALRPAALLLDCAEQLTPADDRADAVRRAVDAAYLHYESGDSPRAEAQLNGVIAGLAPGGARARALMRLGRVLAYSALLEAAQTFAQAVEEAEGDREILAVAHEGVATCLFRLLERLVESVEHAELASAFALELGNASLAAEALGTQWAVESLLGRKGAAKIGERALELQPATEDGRILAQPRFARAAGPLRWTGALAEARAELVELLGRASELGDESSRPLALAQLAQIECDLGELETARVRALEAQASAEQSGQHTVFAFTLALEGLAEARLGRVDQARSLVGRALELVPGTGGRQAEDVATTALGQLELVLGDPAAAVERISDFLAFLRAQGLTEPCAIPFAVDAIEAFIELGRQEEALDLLNWLEGNARRLERASALANCARCRGQLAAQTGALENALAAYEEALDWHAKVELPLDRGRTLLALGAAQRRANRRREARQTLDEALAVFERIGAALWADRTRAELKRISGRAASPGELTPAEERVAALVAEGKTNREVAAALFLSERTVEGHLTHVFGKLGIAHRSEVGAALAARQTQGVAASNTGDSPVSAETVSP